MTADLGWIFFSFFFFRRGFLNLLDLLVPTLTPMKPTSMLMMFLMLVTIIPMLSIIVPIGKWIETAVPQCPGKDTEGQNAN
jgi:hypothetical protein